MRGCLVALLLLSSVRPLWAQMMTADGFESGSFDLWRLQTWGQENRGTIAAPPEPFEGGLAFRSVAGPDAMMADRHWCEVGRYFGSNDSERWWGFAVYFPEDWKFDSQNTVVSQVYSKTDRDLEETSAIVPVLVLRVEDKMMILESRYDENEISRPELYGKGGTVKNQRLWETPLELGRWMAFVFHARFSHDPSGPGLLEVWRDGEKIVEAEGPNTFNNKGRITVRVGLYKRYAKDLQPGDWQVAWFDSFRVADQRGSFDLVEPKAGVPLLPAGNLPSDYEGPLHSKSSAE